MISSSVELKSDTVPGLGLPNDRSCDPYEPGLLGKTEPFEDPEKRFENESVDERWASICSPEDVLSLVWFGLGIVLSAILSEKDGRGFVTGRRGDFGGGTGGRALTGGGEAGGNKV